MKISSQNLLKFSITSIRLGPLYCLKTFLDLFNYYTLFISQVLLLKREVIQVKFW